MSIITCCPNAAAGFFFTQFIISSKKVRTPKRGKAAEHQRRETGGFGEIPSKGRTAPRKPLVLFCRQNGKNAASPHRGALFPSPGSACTFSAARLMPYRLRTPKMNIFPLKLYIQKSDE